MSKHTPEPWTWRDVAGAGIQISATLPKGFKFDCTDRPDGADGQTSFMTFTLRDRLEIQIADARWVQFKTKSWNEMQKANAQLMTAAPDLLAALKKLMLAYEAVLPGIAHIVVPDYQLINDAPCDARAAIRKAEGVAS